MPKNTTSRKTVEITHLYSLILHFNKTCHISLEFFIYIQLKPGEQAANHPFPQSKNCGLETPEGVRSRADRRCAMTTNPTVHPGFVSPDVRPR